MSALAKKPVVGSLGGNVLRRFRITLDYPNSRAFFRYTPYYGSDRGLAVVAMTVTPRDTPSPVDPTSGALSVGGPAPSTIVTRLLGDAAFPHHRLHPQPQRPE